MSNKVENQFHSSQFDLFHGFKGKIQLEDTGNEKMETKEPLGNTA